MKRVEDESEKEMETNAHQDGYILSLMPSDKKALVNMYKTRWSFKAEKDLDANDTRVVEKWGLRDFAPGSARGMRIQY